MIMSGFIELQLVIDYLYSTMVNLQYIYIYHGRTSVLYSHDDISFLTPKEYCCLMLIKQ